MVLAPQRWLAGRPHHHPRLDVEYQLARPLFLRLIGQYSATYTDSLRDISDLHSRPHHRRAEPCHPRQQQCVSGFLPLRRQPVPGTVAFFGWQRSERAPNQLPLHHPGSDISQLLHQDRLSVPAVAPGSSVYPVRLFLGRAEPRRPSFSPSRPSRPAVCPLGRAAPADPGQCGRVSRGWGGLSREAGVTLEIDCMRGSGRSSFLHCPSFSGRDGAVAQPVSDLHRSTTAMQTHGARWGVAALLTMLRCGRGRAKVSWMLGGGGSLASKLPDGLASGQVGLTFSPARVCLRSCSGRHSCRRDVRRRADSAAGPVVGPCRATDDLMYGVRLVQALHHWRGRVLPHAVAIPGSRCLAAIVTRSRSTNGFGLNAGFGLKAGLGRIAIFGEWRYSQIFATVPSLTSTASLRTPRSRSASPSQDRRHLLGRASPSWRPRPLRRAPPLRYATASPRYGRGS